VSNRGFDCKTIEPMSSKYQRFSNFQKVSKVPTKKRVQEILEHESKESILGKVEDDQTISLELEQRTKLSSKKGQNIQDVEFSCGQRILKYLSKKNFEVP
jgi:hypothetical protein